MNIERMLVTGASRAGGSYVREVFQDVDLTLTDIVEVLPVVATRPSDGAGHPAVGSRARPPSPVDALKRLIRFQATRGDLDALKQSVGGGYRSHVLRCLWIDQLYRQRERQTDS